METYNIKTMNESIPASIIAIEPLIEARQVVLVIGAGVSMAPPTCLPSGTQLAQDVKTRLASSPISSIVQPVREDNLLAIADIIEEKALESFPLFTRAIIESANFKMATPNYAHLVIALLLTETNVQVLSINWDTCIERCSYIVSSSIIGCYNHEILQNHGNSSIFLKLHGCANHESSICISSKQISGETWWATSQVGAALETGKVAFLGIGSIAEYMKISLKKILERSRDPSNVFIIDPELSTDWNDLFADAHKYHIQTKSEEFLDDILRALTLSQISRVHPLAREIDKQLLKSDIDIAASVKQVCEFLSQYPAHYIWWWVRRGFFTNGQYQSILDPSFVQILLALAFINCVSPLREMKSIGDTSFMLCDDFTLEIAWARDPTASNQLCRKKIYSLIEGKTKHLLPQTYPFVILAYGHSGVLPSKIMKESVIAEPPMEDIIVGSQALDARWINVTELTQTRTIEDIRQILGS